ncbi:MULTISPECIES: nuclear transport factor 2 family protein [unclassified Shimia]|uniref:nuclear transport factor 2 family protein n=1 Tax=unclassified Shimia TaxID=2630038 RepID=UPI00333FAEF2
MTRPPLPPFTQTSARQKVRAAEDAWNSRNPDIVTPAYSEDSVWRNRSSFVAGRTDIHAFLTQKWHREHEYRLIKGLWTFAGHRIAVRFAYEWHDVEGQWFRSYGNENWEFAEDGHMRRRIASINDLAISHTDRLFHWPLGPRPEGHPDLEDLSL